jgi:hypothetical protein
MPAQRILRLSKRNKDQSQVSDETLLFFPVGYRAMLHGELATVSLKTCRANIFPIAYKRWEI